MQVSVRFAGRSAHCALKCRRHGLDFGSVQLRREVSFSTEDAEETARMPEEHIPPRERSGRRRELAQQTAECFTSDVSATN